KMSDDRDRAAELVIDALTTPSDLAEARRKIGALADYLQEIRVGAHPSPRRAPFVASYYWGLADPTTWPVAWPKSMEYLDFLTGAGVVDDQRDRYTRLHEFVLECDGDPLRFERVAEWWYDERPVLVDEVLCDRAAFRTEADRDEVDARPERYLPNARALVAVSAHIGAALEPEVSEAAGRTLKAAKPSPMWTPTRPRGDLWVDWRVPQRGQIGPRIWINHEGMAIGLRPYPSSDAAADERGMSAAERAIAAIERHPLPGYELLGARGADVGRGVGLVGASGELIYAKWFPKERLAQIDVAAEAVRAASELVPLMDALLGTSQSASARPGRSGLDELVEEFRDAVGYPTPAHEQHLADRREFARMLDSEELPIVDRSDLRRLWNSSRYGGVGPMPTLNITVRDADEAEYARIVDAFDYLCWGAEKPAVRIDRVLEDERLRVKGLGETVMLKMLAVAHPDRFLTVYPYIGPMGKLRMLKALGLEAPTGDSRGELQVAANDALREVLDPHFPGDPLGMGQFLYWLVARDEDEPDGADGDADPLGEVADELLVDREFVDDIVALLESKKQIVLYGPPGTGKTYFARRLARALVPDAERRPIVQFHPSTSYEDFFEGYRPETDADGAMTYRLRRGPLAELAERAKSAPGRRHIMVIDEINRANLPKALGELLFLLEYRDTPIRTLYRPDEPFELPADVWFIGTMNTADRSIALVDAALRRRFHFVPFFPNHGPMAGLLDRWLARHEEPAWVGEIVAQVNAELEHALGGPHLQLGPSHFMRRDLDERSMRRIWEYDIEPFIEDQFFGDPARIEWFRFEQVWARFNEVARESVVGDAEPDSGDG
ncbi:MAG: AAA domain-containing protein, partial [Microbacteriaceae bacterium]|nr:AAA domain-containing protein [Microbacteriaceae bacterium]